jgi:elongation factor 2
LHGSAVSDQTVETLQGTVSFSAGLHAWAFSIPQFAKFYAAKTSTPYEKWVDRLWGEHFLDTKTGKWQKSKTNDNVRGFVKFIYEPIFNILQAAMHDQRDKLFAMCEKLGITAKLSSADKKLDGKKLMKRVMQVRPTTPCMTRMMPCMTLAASIRAACGTMHAHSVPL